VNLSVAQAASLVKGTVEGLGDLSLSGINTLKEAISGELSFYGNTKYQAEFLASRASAIFVHPDTAPHPSAVLIRVENPHLAFARIAAEFHPPPVFAPGQSPQAFVDTTASVDPSSTVFAGAFIGAHANIGAKAVLFPGAFVGAHAKVGAHSVLYNNATVAERCSVGERCIIHTGAVIGADGFGFAFDNVNLVHVKIPQAGIVRVEDDVEVGANACIDRATTGETVVGRGTKIDNLVQVAHNCTIGPLSIICAQAGLSGSTSLGQGVTLGGQSGTAGHQHIGDLTRVGAQSGVLGDVPAQQTVMGSPAFAVTAFYKAQALFQRLPELFRKLRSLEKTVSALERQLPPKGPSK
jgi:UDP-3-O-[3-hydroxymyristoyl] glucosamine N-acyltransferase